MANVGGLGGVPGGNLVVNQIRQLPDGRREGLSNGFQLNCLHEVIRDIVVDQFHRKWQEKFGHQFDATHEEDKSRIKSMHNENLGFMDDAESFENFLDKNTPFDRWSNLYVSEAVESFMRFGNDTYDMPPDKAKIVKAAKLLRSVSRPQARPEHVEGLRTSIRDIATNLSVHQQFRPRIDAQFSHGVYDDDLVRTNVNDKNILLIEARRQDNIIVEATTIFQQQLSDGGVNRQRIENFLRQQQYIHEDILLPPKNSSESDEEYNDRAFQQFSTFTPLKLNIYVDKPSRELIESLFVTTPCDCSRTWGKKLEKNRCVRDRCPLLLSSVECYLTATHKCGNMRLQLHQDHGLVLFRTKRCGIGVMSTTKFSSGQLISEFVGILRHVSSFENIYNGKEKYSLSPFRHLPYILDTESCGNIGRFFNHSCNPNAKFSSVIVDFLPRTFIQARRPISEGEEITVSYFMSGTPNYPYVPQVCMCGEVNCCERF